MLFTGASNFSVPFMQPQFARALNAGGSGPDITSGLLDWWKFDEGSGTTATDSGTAAHNGVIRGPTYVTGKIGPYCLSFSAANSDDVLISSACVPSGSASKTVAMWARLTVIGTRQFLFYGGAESSNGRFCLEIESSKLNLNYFSDAVVGATTLASNTWYHVAATYDGATAKVYLNGALDGSKAVTLATGSSTSTYLGTNVGALRLTGNEDDVRVYDRALSALEMAALYAYT